MPEDEYAATAAERPDVLHLATITLPHHLGSSVYSGPATIAWQTAGGSTFRQSAFELGASFAIGDEIARSDSRFTHTGLLSETRQWHRIADDALDTVTYTYDALGRVLEVESATGHVTQNAAYDVLGRVLEVKEGTSTSNTVTVAKFYYDDFDRQTDDSDTDQEQGVGNGVLSWVEAYTGEGSEVRRTRHLYDWRDRRVSSVTPQPPYEWLEYDNLDRVTARGLFNGDTDFPSDVDTPVADRGMYSETKYSQRGLVYCSKVAVDGTDSTPDFLRSDTWFDEVGRVIGQVSPNGPGVKTVYDGLGRAVEQYVTDRNGDAAPGASGNYSDVADVISGYVRGVDLQNDRVVEQSTSEFNADGSLILSSSTKRFHAIADTVYGALDEDSGVVSYVGYVYDAADRLVATINYGTASTNDLFEAGGTEPTVPTTLPGSAPTNTLMTVTEYNTRGLVHRVYDPAGKATEYRYDDLGRRIAVIENAQDDPDDVVLAWYTPGTPLVTNPARWRVTDGLDKDAVDENRVTSTVYDGDGNVAFYIAHTPDPSDSSEDVQITAYVYGTTAGSASNVMDSLVYSNSLLFKVHYPDESTGMPNTGASFTVEYAYNRVGELRGMKDQNGTVHAYARDLSGRVTSDKVTTFGTNIDQTVKRITVGYDDFGRLEHVKSRTHATDDTDTYVRNHVAFDYTPLWQTEAIYQTQLGALPGSIPSTFPAVEYVYGTSATDNRSRLDAMIYPLDAEAASGTPHTLDFSYGTSGSLNDRISRVVAVDRLDDIQTGNMADFLEYSYVGAGMFATVEYADAVDVLLDRTYQHDGKRRSSGKTTQPAGVYPGWDRFGRVRQQSWIRGDSDHNATLSLPTRAPLMEQVYGYDTAGNRTSMDDERPGSKGSTRDERYVYDGLDRLKEANRGRLTNTPSWDAGKGSQVWNLDMLGNWRGTDIDTVSAFGTYDSSDDYETRVHNQANEIAQLDPNPDSPLSYKPLTHDDAGNLRFVPYTVSTGGSTSTGDRYTYDAWNRLVRIETILTGGPTGSGAEVVRYDYNGLHWRTRRLVTREYGPVGSPPLFYSGTEEWRLYYSAAWQLIEERVDEDADSTFESDRASQQFWGLRYIDDAVARRVTSDTGDTWDRSYYHITNVQFSTESLIDDVGELVERVRYDAYGKARHSWPEDLDGNGSFGAPDRAIGDDHVAGSSIGDTGTAPSKNYNVLMDFDFSGTIETDEYTRCQNGTGIAALAAGQISDMDFDAGPWNPVGFDGYVYDDVAELACVRFRWYEAEFGRWISRDAAKDTSGGTLYAFATQAPTVNADWSGLWAEPGGDSAEPNSRLRYEVGTKDCVKELRKALQLGCPQARLLLDSGASPFETKVNPKTFKEWEDIATDPGSIDVNDQTDEDETCPDECKNPPGCVLLRRLMAGFDDKDIVPLISSPRERGDHFDSDLQTDAYQYEGKYRGRLYWDCDKSIPITDINGKRRQALPFEILWHELHHMYHDVTKVHNKWGEGWEEVKAIDGENDIIRWYNKCTDEGRADPVADRDPFGHKRSKQLRDQPRPWEEP